MEDLKNVVVSTVESAIRCGVSHRGLEGMIRSEYLKRAETQPKRPVVYNADYGGHDLSPAFENFIKKYDDSHEPYYKALGYGQFLCENGFTAEDCTGKNDWARQPFYPVDPSEDAIAREERTKLFGLFGLIASRTVKPLPSERNELWEKVGLHFASGAFASLAVAWIPSGVSYRVEEYDGKENVVW